ncbi:hypothetical protein OBBRIDRAFT_806790 [Obba rivulosa]|uniref:DUF6533 domain-containing protein n=1 Tax=Obba rivulosa TaxID=1052685 RepID=A0A8E2DGW5_9APHY|nr:hypothetical protein OBBRIDRAFT_806790 [Obba rivulosa]
MSWIAAGALVFYDYTITLPQELEYIWHRKLSSVSVLYGLNRLALLIWASDTVHMLTGFGRTSSKDLVWSLRCTLALDMWHVCTILLALIRAAFASLRIYAVGGGQWGLPVVVLILGLASMCTEIASSREYRNRDLCGARAAPALCVRVSQGPMVCDHIAEHRSYSIKQMVGGARGRGWQPLTATLLRDGTAHFIVLTVLPVVTYLYDTDTDLPPSVQTVPPIEFHLAPGAHPPYAQALSIMSAFQTPLMSLTVSHFLLNLREAAYGTQPGVLNSQEHPAATNPSSRLSLWFNSFVGDMGESLVIASDDPRADEDWEADVRPV